MTDSIQKIPNKELTLGKKLGEGGFGIVYKGKWQGTDVAIKKLRMTTLSPQKQAEFTQESGAMSRLNSPRIIHLFGICTEPGNYAMVMAFMPGGDLHDLLDDQTIKLPWSKRWELAIDIGAGLTYLHAKKIIHRDLKSLNILLDRDKRAIITDFGLAKLRQHTKSIYTDKVKGSIPWMAPELFGRRAKVSEKSDVFAYGMVLWELASRKIPFSDALDPNIVPNWIMQGEREDIPKESPKPYAEVIERCWKGKPEERPTAAMALEQLLKVQPKKQEAPLHNNNSSEPLKKSISSTNNYLPKGTKPGFSFGSTSFQKRSDHGVTSHKEGSSIKPIQDVPTFDDWQCLKTLEGHRSMVLALTALEGNSVASGSVDCTVKIWDVISGACLKTLKGHSSMVLALTALPNGHIVSASYDKKVKIWDVTSGACLKTLKVHSRWVFALTSLPNGHIASASYDKKVKIWDVTSGACLKTLKGHGVRVKALTALPNGNIASGSGDNTVKIWDVTSGACLKTLKGHSNTVNALTTLTNGRIASGSSDNTVKIWDVTSGACLKALKGHSNTVNALTALPNGRIASGSDANTVKIWDVTSGACLKTLKGHSGSVHALTALPNGRIASGSHDKTVKIWGASS